MLLNPKFIGIAIVVVIIIGLGITIKAQSIKIGYLEKKIEEKEIVLAQKQALLDTLELKIVEQNASIRNWQKEADVQAWRVKEANKKADEKMRVLSKVVQEILTTRIPKDKEVEWANEELKKILEGF
jgi:uncharacterized coiled-coil protein SlyX